MGAAGAPTPETPAPTDPADPPAGTPTCASAEAAKNTEPISNDFINPPCRVRRSRAEHSFTEYYKFCGWELGETKTDGMTNLV
jgi:hypothetical protein